MKKFILFIVLTISIVSLAINTNVKNENKKDIGSKKITITNKKNDKNNLDNKINKIQSEKYLFVDTDGDGVPDDQDLDSDNDGILDAEEMFGSCSGNYIYSKNGYNGVLYDNTETVDIDSWAQFEKEGIFPSSSYQSVATFEYFEFENTRSAFDIIFTYTDTNSPNGFTSNNKRQLKNFSGTGIYSDTNNSDFAAVFTKVISKNDAGTYNFQIYKGDNHIIIYKNNNVVFKQNDVWSKTVPINAGDIIFEEGDIFKVVLIEEGTYNTEIDLRATRLGQCIKDTDNDGIPDYLDLDSDNDGCPDAIEGDGTITYNQLDANRRISGGVNSNGIPLAVGTGQGAGNAYNSSILDCDYDGDNVTDDLDQDYDNDGILNTIECNSSNRITDGLFPTTGDRISLPSWVVSGTYATTPYWETINEGLIIKNSNGLQFMRDNSTQTVVKQTMTGKNLKKGTVSLNGVKWGRSVATNLTNDQQNFTFELKIGGIIYLTITNPNGNMPIVKAHNNATTTVTNLPTTAIGTTSTINTTINVNLPNDENLHQGDVELVFKAGSSNNNVHDLILRSISITSCQDTDNDGLQDLYDLDSDNDGCADAMEGAGTITFNQLNNNGSINSPVNNNGVPTLVGAGQGVGSAINPTVNTCICNKSANTTGTALSTNVGITTVTKDTDWPQKIKGAHLALESRTKGLVINKINGSEITTKIINPKEGMVVFDPEDDCIKIYSKDMNASTYSWKCFNTQTCPDN
jgi:hypothetical protein